MKPLFASLFAACVAAALPALAGEVDTVAVLEIRSRSHPIIAGELSDRLRDAVRRTLPDARLVDREGGADLVVTGKLSRGGFGFRAWLELRDREGEVLQRATATASTRAEIVEAVEGAALDLLRSRKEEATGAITIRATPLPEVPAPPDPTEMNVDVDPSVLVAWDRARQIEARGKENPEQAASAWRRVAELRGLNPLRELATSRAQQWEAYAAGKRSAEAALSADTARLRRVLPLGSVSDAAKLDLLVRYAAAHGFDKVSPLVALLPSAELRARAELSLDCEVKEAHACVQLARAADGAKDPRGALDYLDRACSAGSAEACAEAGDRFLLGELRDPARAVAALQRGCDAANAAACVRLARVYEEGDGAATDAKVAADLRDKACSAGDGKSCRRLAGMSDEPGRVADLLRKGCDGGDGVSCALAAREPAIVKRQLQEAAAGAKKTPMVQPASATGKAAEKPAVPAASAPRTEATPPRDHVATGVGMVLFGALAGTGAVLLTMDGNDNGGHHSGRNFASQTAAAAPPPARTLLTVVMGSAALISTGVGLAAIFSKPDKPEEPKVGVGVSPGGVVVSGQFH